MNTKSTQIPDLMQDHGSVYSGMIHRLIISALFAAALAATATAQTRSMEAVRLSDQALSIDGSLDDSAWNLATPATDFLQREPFEGESATERTEVRVLYDDSNLYVGAMMYESEPDGMIGFQKERDAFLFTDDRFMLSLDTFRDGRTGYFFETNPAGLLGDGLLAAGSRFGVNKSWDGIWEVRVQQTEEGWSAEFRIPFGTMNFNPDNSTWGINFQRTVRRKNEEAVWNGHRRNQSIFQPIHNGTLTGLSGMSQGIGLEVRPYALTNVTRTLGEDGPELRANAGFDITYSVTANMRASATVNTDFAEVEVDQRRVNLTRFPLVFPEKRPFFLEGSSVFTFAPRNGADPYFSRRIGLADGEQIPIRYGLRLAGQQGPWDLGLLHVRTGPGTERPGEDFSVARLKRNFLEQSSIGAIATRRSASEWNGAEFAPDQYTLGTDLELTTRRFLGDRNLNFQAFLAWHNPTDFEDDSSDWNRTVRGLRWRYDNEPISVATSYREYGSNYDPAIGFVRRNGYKRVEPQFDYEPQLPNSDLIRELGFGVAFENITDLDNRLLTRGWDFDLLQVEFESGDFFGIDFETAWERLEESFEILDGVTIPVDDYRFNTVSVGVNSARRRKVSVSGDYSYGSFWDGRRTEYEAGITIRPQAGISLEADWERNVVTLPEGGFNTNLYRFEGGWQVSPWTSWNSLLQYDTVSELLTVFSRFRWTVRPGSDLFLVFARNWENEFAEEPGDERRFRLRAFETGFTAKVNYTHRF